MTSQSSVGSTRITLQFGLNRDIDGAARDVQAAINAARADLPASLRSNPTYHKVNPADAPILILALTSNTLTAGQLYDSAATVLQQSLSQVDGIGEVDVSGSANPAVRVELEPQMLFHYGIGLEDVRAALAAANANSPKGSIEFGPNHVQLYTNDQASKASQYKDLIIAYRNGAAVHLSDVSEVVDSVEDLRNLGLYSGKHSVLVILSRQPGANIIETIDRVKAMLPQLKASLPADVEVTPTVDRSTTIRASLKDTEHTLMIAVALVVMVVFLFLRNWRATLIPSVAVPISIIGTFGAMYLMGFSIDNLSLMALTIATGFVVDDAIVVLENISRHIENGVPRREAAFRGAREVGFTVVSISISLVAVFLPILLMGGIVGRLFREFALTLSLAIAVSLLVSLTLTPMMCSRLLNEPHEREEEGRFARWLERGFQSMQRGYEHTLGWSLRHPLLILLVLLATIGLNVWLYVIIPKGFFPQQDTGRLVGGIQADQSTSFQAMKGKFAEMMKIVGENPAVEGAVGYTGGRQTNSGFMFVQLKPKPGRRVSADQVIQQLRGPLSEVAGVRTFLQAVQDIRVGGRQSNAQYQFTLLADSTTDLYTWGPKLTEALQARPELADVNSDQQCGAAEHRAGADRQHAVRRVRPASGVDDLQPAEPVPRGDGSGAEVLAKPGHAEADLRQYIGGQRERRADHQRDGGHGDCAGGQHQQHERIGRRHGGHDGIERGGDCVGFGAQPGDQFACGERQIERVVGGGGVDVEGDDDSVVGDCEFWSGEYAVIGESPEPVRGLDDLVQLAAGQIVVGRDPGDLRHDGGDRHAGDDPRQFPGDGAGVPAVLVGHAALDSGGVGGGVYRAGDTV
jgi:multidrug efflux pump